MSSDSGEERLQALQELLEDDPSDAFTRYGVAMQLKGLERYVAALAHFKVLLEEHPDYVASYYHHAGALHAEGETARALEVIELGCAAAAEQGDRHAQNELEDLREELE